MKFLEFQTCVVLVVMSFFGGYNNSPAPMSIALFVAFSTFSITYILDFVIRVVMKKPKREGALGLYLGLLLIPIVGTEARLGTYQNQDPWKSGLIYGLVAILMLLLPTLVKEVWKQLKEHYTNL